MTAQTIPARRRTARTVDVSGSRHLHRTASAIALATGMIGFAGFINPAAAQCVEGIPSQYLCSGDNQTGQAIVGDDVSAATDAGFSVDTTSNGNGMALTMTGAGQITYIDLQASSLIGAGVRITSTGSSGLDGGSINVFSDGAIIANGANGLRLVNNGGNQTSAVWSGSILNTTGNGVLLQTEFGSGDATLSLGDVQGEQDGLWAQFGGNGSLAITTTGPLTGVTGAGLRIGTGAASDDVTVEVVDVTGGSWGILVDHQGDDFTRVVSTGIVTGLGDAGIAVTNGGVTTTSIEILANTVTGATRGIDAGNFGTGATTIVATGTVTGGISYGVSGFNDVTATNLSIETVDVVGSRGIVAENNGTGETEIVSTGVVTGFALNGIDADNGVTAGAMTIDVHDVFGAQNGVDVVNFGSGQTRVFSDGQITGNSEDGIAVQDGTGSTGILLMVADVSGETNGIDIVAEGAGATVVEATGTISGALEDGISIDNGVGTTELWVDVVDVDGGASGIRTNTDGSGGTFILVSGTASGDDFGIIAENGSTTTDILINAANVVSNGTGISADNEGSSFVYILSSGAVVGAADTGIRAFASSNSFGITVEANNVSGGVAGISAIHFGGGMVDIQTTGIVEGGDNAIEAFSDLGDVSILNEGTVRNSSGLSSDLAITSIGVASLIGNQGLLVGAVDVTADSSLLVNNADWNSVGGTSTFAGADDWLSNASTATIFGAASAGVAETTTWSGLEVFVNSGELLLADGGTGDVVQTSATTTLGATSLLTADIGGAGETDTFRTTGAVTIDAGSLLIVNTAQPLVLHSQYIVVDAAGGLTGEFEFDDQMLTNFAGLRDGYTANTAFVEFAQMKALADAALTPNQEETAFGADSLPDGNAVKDALLLLPDDEAAQDAFDQLSGEIHPSVRTVVAEDSRLPRTAVLDRLGYDAPERSAWGRAFGSSGGNDGDSNAAELDRETRGFLVGVDTTFGESITVGVAGGWLESNLDIGERDSEGTVESLSGLAYVGGRFGAFGVRGGVGYAATSADTRRRIAFPGFAAVTTARYDGTVLQGFVEAGYRLPLGKGSIEPFVNLTALKVESDAFTETGGGDANLSGDSASEQTTVSTVGLRFETGPISGPLALRGSTGWRHVSGDLDPVNVHAFDGGVPFTILGATQSSDAFVANVEARWTLSPALSFGVAYDGVLGSDGQDHAVTGSFRVIF